MDWKQEAESLTLINQELIEEFSRAKEKQETIDQLYKENYSLMEECDELRKDLRGQENGRDY